MTWTSDQLSDLEAAIALGATTVQLEGPNGTKRVTFRSLADMRSLRAQIRRELGLDPADSGLRYLDHDRRTGR